MTSVSLRSGSKKVSRYESLRNMNTSSGKFASWLVCVRDPQVQPVRFNARPFGEARGQWIEGHRFSCVLTSADEKEYMFGAVPFDFKNRHAAQQAAEKFTDMSVWQISKPNFDGRSKPEFISAPLKSVLLMRGPTDMTKIDEVLRSSDSVRKQGCSLASCPNHSKIVIVTV